MVLNISKSLHDVANELGIELKPHGIYQRCPVCHGSTSFIVNRDDDTYKCFKPSCDLYKKGNAISFYMYFKHCTYTEAETYVEGVAKSKNVITNPRGLLLEELFSTLQSKLRVSPRGLSYLQDRYLITYQDLTTNLLYNDIGYTDGSDIPSDIGYFDESIIFAIRDMSGGIVHYHTRNIAPPHINKNNIRWKGTSKLDGGKAFSDYIWNAHHYLNKQELFLTEGISDGLTLTKLGLPTISILSLTAPILELIPLFRNLRNLTILLDNDKVSLSSKYKSWDAVDKSGLSILDKLLILSSNNPKLNIWCAMPPNKVGIKDINDWVLKHRHTQESFIKTLTPKVKLAPDFAIEHYWQDTSKHKLIIKSINNQSTKELFLHNVRDSYTNWFDYIQQIV